MGLFDKKYCSVCGGKIGFLGNRKLEDGNLCKECASKLSPFFSDRRSSTVEEIKAQLAYREANQADVAAFECTRTIGEWKKLYVDENAHRFLVSSSSRWQSENPDVIDCGAVTDCRVDITENRSEVKVRDEEGKMVPADPPREKVSTDFKVVISVNHPYFDSITLRVNSSSLTEEFEKGASAERSEEYRKYVMMAEEARNVLMEQRAAVKGTTYTAPQSILKPEAEPEVPAAEPEPVVCPYCGAKTTPVNGCCEFCGSRLVPEAAIPEEEEEEEPAELDGGFVHTAKPKPGFGPADAAFGKPALGPADLPRKKPLLGPADQLKE